MESSDLKFTPSINTKKQDSSQADVTERLCKDAVDRAEKKYRKTELANQMISEQHPFAPTLMQSRMSKEDEEEFFERQQMLDERRRAHEDVGLNETDCTFQPKINYTSKALVGADPKRSCETEEERINRLAQRDKKRDAYLQEIVNAENKSKYTYQPEINKKQKIIKPIAEQEVKAYKKQSRMQELEKRDLKECTFHPQIKKSAKTESHYKKTENIIKSIKEKEKEMEVKREQKKKDAEYEETIGCTFKPDINKAEVVQELTTIAGTYKNWRNCVRIGKTFGIAREEEKIGGR